VGSRIEIRYTLTRTTDVTLYLSEDGGVKWTPLTSCLSGDVGRNVTPGACTAVWDVLACRESLVGSHIRFKVLEGDYNPCLGADVIRFDGYDYPTVAIGEQCWFKENLRSDNYLNGDPIPGNLSDLQWATTYSGAQAIYGEGSSKVSKGSGNEVSNLAVHGRLYNCFAVIDPRGLCPYGWHVPWEFEWDELLNNVGSQSNAATFLKSKALWNGLHSDVFSALPSGYRSSKACDFDFQGSHAGWWSQRKMKNGYGHYLWLFHDYPDAMTDSVDCNVGLSVRCIRNEKWHRVTGDNSEIGGGLSAESRDEVADIDFVDLKDACDCLEASEIVFATYADLLEEHKETIDAYMEAMRSGVEPSPEIQEKFDNEVTAAFAEIDEKGPAIGEVCDPIVNIQAVIMGVDSVDCPNVESLRKAFERATSSVE
jgi:uncharacterized protein (TIGR02145 family)